MLFRSPFIGKFYSNKWVQKHVLQFDDELIEQMKKEIDEEEADGTGGPTLPQNQAQPDMQQEQPTEEQYPPENNTQEVGSQESKTPMLDAAVDKYSAGLNKK